jgi:hypothetical protein
MKASTWIISFIHDGIPVVKCPKHDMASYIPLINKLLGRGNILNLDSIKKTGKEVKIIVSMPDALESKTGGWNRNEQHLKKLVLAVDDKYGTLDKAVIYGVHVNKDTKRSCYTWRWEYNLQNDTSQVDVVPNLLQVQYLTHLHEPLKATRALLDFSSRNHGKPLGEIE